MPGRVRRLVTLSFYDLGPFLSQERALFVFCLGLSRDALLSSSVMGLWRRMCEVDASYQLFSSGLVHTFFWSAFL